MIKKKKIVGILLAVILFITFNLLFILNGCSSNNSDEIGETMVEQSQSISSNEDSESATDSDESAASENDAQKTDVLENENNSQVNDKEVGKEETDSSKSSNTYSEEEGNTLEDIYQRFLESGRPSILVFSYDADCCPGTKAFFEEYNDAVMKLMKSYTGDFDALFINIGILGEKNMDTAVEIASQNNVLNIPSILILDRFGNGFKVIEGPFDKVEVKKILDGMLDD